MGTISRLYTFKTTKYPKGLESDNELNQILAVLNGNIEAANLKNGGIVNDFANGAVTESKLGALSVGATALKTVGTANFAADSVTTAKLKTGFVCPSGNTSSHDSKNMADYSFFPSIECKQDYLYLAAGGPVFHHDTRGRFTLVSSGGTKEFQVGQRWVF